jgi:hypothetical protein
LSDGSAIAEASLEAGFGERDGDRGPVQIESRFGAGRAVYLNLAVCEYLRFRTDPKNVAAARALRRRVAQAVAAAGLRPPVLVDGDGLPTLVERVALRARDGRNLLAVRLNATDDRSLFATLQGRGDRDVQLVFPDEVVLTDLRSGEELGTERRFALRLGPARALFLSWELGR